MSSSFTWFIHDHLGPLRTSHTAQLIGRALATSILIDYHLVVPVDGFGMVDRLAIVGGGPGWVDELRDFMTVGDLWSSLESSRAVVLYSRRRHDIIDQWDEENTVFMASWLATYDVQLLDWFVLTLRSIRSIPDDFALPRGW